MPNPVTAIVGGATLFSAKQQADAAEAAAERSGDAARLQYHTAQDRLEFEKERFKEQKELADRFLQQGEQQWQTYKERILPIELQAAEMGIDAQELALQRGQADFELFQNYYRPLQQDIVTEAREGIKPQYERVTREAAQDVSTQFDRARAMERRDLERLGVNPSSGRYAGLQRQSQLAEAAARGSAINRAREAERDRAEDINFARKLNAIGLQPTMSQPTQRSGQPGIGPSTGAARYGQASAALSRGAAGVSGAYSGLSGAYGSAADRFQRQAQMYGSGAANTVRAGIGLASRMGGMWSGGGGGMTQSQHLAKQWGPGASWQYQHGGEVREPSPGYAHGGPVNAPGGVPPDIMADNYGAPIRIDERPHVGLVRGPPGPDQVPATVEGQQPARLTAGEYVVPEDVVARKGTEFFDRLIEQYHEGGPAPNAGLRRQ